MTKIQKVKALLTIAGITTIADLDRWCMAHPYRDKVGIRYPSRFKALKQIAGEDGAIDILNNLAINQCLPKIAKRHV